MDQPVVIIGAGLGGLSTAIHLASKKHQVVIFEKNSSAGGNTSETTQDGFRWNDGLPFLMMRDVFESLFTAVGKRLEDYLQLMPVNSVYRCFYPNGKSLEVYRDLSRTVENIAAIDGRDVDGYLSFLAYAAKQDRFYSPHLIFGAPPTWGKLLMLGIKNLSEADLFKDYSTVIEEHIDSPELRQFLLSFALLSGNDPYQASALLSNYAHQILTKGIWYPRGGMYGIVQALERLAIEMGVKIRYEMPVEEIVVQDKSVVGLLLSDGRPVESEFIISNVDPLTTFEKFLPKKPPYLWASENIAKLPMTNSAFILHLGIKERFTSLGHNNIFFSKDFQKEMKQITSGLLPDDPTLQITISSKSDHQHAPMGAENWIVRANVPPLQEKQNWSEQANRFKDVILRKINSFGYDIGEKIVAERIITPTDLELKSGTWRGSLFGPSFRDWTMPSKRQHPLPKAPEGLYFVGKSTYPGAGIPLILLSGKYVANLVNKQIHQN